MKLSAMIRSGPFATATLATVATVDSEAPQVSQVSQLSQSQFAPEPPQVSQVSQLSQSQTAPEPDIAVGNSAAEADLDDEWVERAAIAEYDGKLHKGVAELVADACHPATLPKAEPDDWPGWFAAEITKRAPALGPEAARRRVVGKALGLWHLHHGKRGEPGRCAGCGGFLPASETFTLGDGATIHAYETFMECLIAYGNHWRPAALAGLRRLGVPISESEL